MKKLLIVGGLILAWLQYTLWFGPSGHFAQARLAAQLTAQQAHVDALTERNALLLAEVLALKEDDANLEARARNDLGMVKKGEVFYLVPSES